MTEFNQNKSNKRLLESPDSVINHQSKITKSDNKNMPEQLTSQQEYNITPSLSNAMETNLDERDKTMLVMFKGIIEDQFKTFAKTEIAPLTKEVTDWKEENKALKEELKTCVERINFLEKIARETNLVFSNVPATSDNEKSIEELCTQQLKVGTPAEIDKVVPIGKNENKNTVTLLVSFVSRRTADRVLMKSSHLKGTGIGLSRDYPKDVRNARNLLLILRRKILEMRGNIKVKVYGNTIVIGKEKLTYINNDLSNDRLDGKQYVLDNFGIDFNEICSTNNQ